MKTTNIFLKMMLVALVAITTSSCNDLFGEHDTSWNGSQVEVTPLSGSVEVAVDETASVPVTTQLIAEQRDTDLTFGLSVVDSLTSADAGVYSVPSSVTIPANSSSGVYNIDVSGAAFPAPVTVAVELEGTEGVEPAENLKTFTLTITNPAAEE